jgi:cell division protein FtsQ
VKLPADDPDSALASVVALDAESGLLSKDIAAVDMRLGDRLVIKLTPEAAMTRDATLKERTQGAYKPEKKV